MKRMYPWQTVRGRLLFLAIGLEALMLTVLITNSIRLLHSAMSNQVQSQAQQFSPVLIAALTAPLAARDYATMQAVVDESRIMGGLDYIVVVDRYGHRIAANGWPAAMPLPESSKELSLFENQNGPRYNVTMPIAFQHQPLGMLHFGINLSQLVQARKELLLQGVGIAAIEVVLSSALLLLLGFWLTRHMTLLTKASLDVASGNLSPSLLPEGDDDVGQLGIAFNIMSRVIKERVAELTAAKETAEAGETQLRSITHSANDAILMMDPQGAISYWNPAAEQILGYQAEEALGQDLHKLLVPEQNRIAKEEVFPEFLRTGCGNAVGKTLELFATRKDGQEITVALSLSAVFLYGAWHTVGILRDITERKESIRLLAQAKEEADTIIRNFLDTLIVISTDLKIIRVNQATCDLLGFSEKELIGKNVSELFHDSKEHVQSVFSFYADRYHQQLELKQELRNIELCYRNINGDRLPMSFNISLLLDDDGAVTGVVAGAKDVSRLRLALDKIALQKEYIETLFDIVPEGLLALSPSREVMKQNQAFKQILHTWSKRLDMTPEECACSLIEKILERQAENDTFTLHIRRDDTTAYFRCSSTVIAVLEGIASVVSIEDITEERKAEEERRLLATVIEQTGDSVIIGGTDEVIQYVNPAALKNSGFSEDELIDGISHIFRDVLLNASVIAELRNTVTNGLIWHGHYKSRRKDDSIIEEDVTISPVRNEEGELTHYVAIKRDITEMILLQRQLLQAQKLEAIGQLAAGIAHEINTPMQYVQNNVSFFEMAFNTLQDLLVEVGKTDRSQLSAEITALLATIELDFLLKEIPESIKETHDGINRVVKIVSAMKQFSHPGGNDKVATDLNRALDSTITVCRNEWKYVAEMITDFDPDLPLVCCFPDQLNQVLLNLIINASHAIQDHNKLDARDDLGRITIGTRKDGTWVEIQISDTGSGIPEAIQQRIFDPFFTTKEVGKGTGQGLAIAHDIIVNKHMGSINFSSTLGEGTTFLIRLPILSA